MKATVFAPASRTHGDDYARRIAVVAALSATTMLFASLVSAYLVRRSFEDWRPVSAGWPWILLALGGVASVAMEIVARTQGDTRRAGFLVLRVSSALYLLSAVAVIGRTAGSEGGLTAPHKAFIALLLGAHVVHALMGAGFSFWALRGVDARSSENRVLLARLVTHFLTALLLAILFVLFVLR